jgi:two-component system KDP operon response regulator KdpE
MEGPNSRILIVDDERPIRRFLRTALSAHGYNVFEASSGEEALIAVTEFRPDLVILDLGLPDISGIEVTQRLREWTALPILVLSVRESEHDKIEALDAGADDYLTKPFGTGELLARIRAAIRRSAQVAGEPTFQMDDLMVDFTHRQVTLKEKHIDLTPTEYDVLKVLVHYAGKVITHRQLLREVWGTGYEDESHILRVNISNLRRKIEPDPAQPHYILTEPGVGYRLRDPS